MEPAFERNIDQWYVYLLGLKYHSIVGALKTRHGRVWKSYFTDASCTERTKEISKAWKGLCIHHIDEDKSAGLSSRELARASSWEYQLPERLVYCNLLEHLILHIKIYEDSKDPRDKLGIYGALRIMKQIDSFYCGLAEPLNRGELNLLMAIQYSRAEFLWIVSYARRVGISYRPNTRPIPYIAPMSVKAAPLPPTRPIPAEDRSSIFPKIIALVIFIGIIIAILVVAI